MAVLKTLSTFFLFNLFVCLVSTYSIEKCGPHPDNRECEGVHNCVVVCKNGFANSKGYINFKTVCKEGRWDETCQPVKCGKPFEIELGYWLDMNNLDGYGCRAPNKPVETPNKCECNKEWRVRDGVREVVPVPAEGVTVSCVNNSSGLVAKVNGFCAIACKKQFNNEEFASQFEEDSLAECLNKNYKNVAERCSLKCKPRHYKQKAINFETSDNKKGTFCDLDSEWVTNTRCSKACPAGGEFRICKDKFEGEKCEVFCRDGDVTRDGKSSFFATCVYNEERGDVEWDKSYYSGCNGRVLPTTTQSPYTTSSTTTIKTTTEWPTTESSPGTTEEHLEVKVNFDDMDFDFIFDKHKHKASLRNLN